jgi:hypothetical protein
MNLQGRKWRLSLKRMDATCLLNYQNVQRSRIFLKEPQNLKSEFLLLCSNTHYYPLAQISPKISWIIDLPQNRRIHGAIQQAFVSISKFSTNRCSCSPIFSLKSLQPMFLQLHNSYPKSLAPWNLNFSIPKSLFP